MEPRTPQTKKDRIPRVELHAHLGSSVHPAVLWEIAHDQGIKLPMSDYWDFEAMITMDKHERNESLGDMHEHFFKLTELIQSSPRAVEASVKSVIGGGYRKCNITVHELRFNPMFRNRGGEQDLDHIISAGLRGMDRAVLEYPQVRAGIILMMDRRLSFEKNSIIVDKAIKYKSRGIIGVDVGGPQHASFSMKEHASLFARAREAGLGITLHTGEEGTVDEMRFVVEHIAPDRIGHGILAAQDETLLTLLAEKNITLELCPTSNIKNTRVPDISALKTIVRALVDHQVPFTINTDGPEMYRTNVCAEEALLRDNGILSETEIETCRAHAYNASFLTRYAR